MKRICTICILVGLLSGCYYIPLTVHVDNGGEIAVDGMTVTGGPKDYQGQADVPVSIVPK